MIRLERTTDLAIIYHYLTLPHVWRNGVDETCPPKELFFPPISDRFIYLKVGDYGLFMAKQLDQTTWEAHIALDKNAYGKAIELAYEAMQWFFDNVQEASMLMAEANNVFTERIVFLLGFKRMDNNMYCMNREVFKCHQQ